MARPKPLPRPVPPEPADHASESAQITLIGPPQSATPGGRDSRHIEAARSALCGQRLVTERDGQAESPSRRWRGLPVMRFGGGPAGILPGEGRITKSWTR